ncbi:MAG: 2-vinyl bacteriochlorophyllide hydratase [Woeseiaceae bacterium]
MARREAFSTNRQSLYTAAEKVRRDNTRWTLVQAILAPLQFVVFIVSLTLVVRYLMTGEGAYAATVSVVLKTLILYAIMITGSLWEKAVFDRYLFVPAFFWEDMVSMLVLALHTAYLICIGLGWLDISGQMYLAIAAYVAYVINAAQFVWKFRIAKAQERVPADASVVSASMNGALR